MRRRTRQLLWGPTREVPASDRGIQPAEDPQRQLRLESWGAWNQGLRWKKAERSERMEGLPSQVDLGWTYRGSVQNPDASRALNCCFCSLCIYLSA